MNSPFLRQFLRQLIAIPVLLLALAGLHACGVTAGVVGRPAAAPAPPPQPVTVALRQGQSVAVAPGASLRLDRVNDSRCRTGAVCVWAGYISYSFTLSRAGGASTTFVLAENMPGAAATVSQNGLSFTLAGVEPAAVPALKAPVPDYQVSVRVSAAPPA